MYLKRNIVDHLTREGITKFILIFDNVLNFHGDDDSYYQEWFEDIKDEGGWIMCINMFEHVKQEMKDYNLNYYLEMPDELNDMNWRILKPEVLFSTIDNNLFKKRLT